MPWFRMTYDGRECRFYKSDATPDKRDLFDWSEMKKPTPEIESYCQEVRGLFNQPRKPEQMVDIRLYQGKGDLRLKGVYKYTPKRGDGGTGAG